MFALRHSEWKFVLFVSDLLLFFIVIDRALMERSAADRECCLEFFSYCCQISLSTGEEILPGKVKKHISFRDFLYLG